MFNNLKKNGDFNKLGMFDIKTGPLLFSIFFFANTEQRIKNVPPYYLLFASMTPSVVSLLLS